MKTSSNAVPIEEQELAASPPGSHNIVQLRAEPQPAPAAAEADRQRSPITSATHKRSWWIAALAAVALLLAGNLAARLLTHHQVPPVASYNSRLADLDAKLSHELARQLHAAGFKFDAAIVSVEAPACTHAVCLVKDLRRDDPLTTGYKAGISVRHAGNGLWSFAGTGWLDKLQFSVDAAKEMQRLGENTPPEFPQVALTALATNQPKPDLITSFDEVVEVLLPVWVEGARLRCLDLETGCCLTEPDREYFANTFWKSRWWYRTNKLDLFAFFDPKSGYWLVATYMAVVPVNARLWEQATPDDLISHPALRPVAQHGRRGFSPVSDQTDTYLFRTDQGTIGILRVLEFDQASHQLKVQYKLARLGGPRLIYKPAALLPRRQPVTPVARPSLEKFVSAVREKAARIRSGKVSRALAGAATHSKSDNPRQLLQGAPVFEAFLAGLE